MKTLIEIRLSLHTIFGPASYRLERGTPLTVKQFDFPDTEEGRKEAEETREKLQAYCDKNHSVKKKK